MTMYLYCCQLFRGAPTQACEDKRGVGMNSSETLECELHQKGKERPNEYFLVNRFFSFLGSSPFCSPPSSSPPSSSSSPPPPPPTSSPPSPFPLLFLLLNSPSSSCSFFFFLPIGISQNQLISLSGFLQSFIDSC
jgi:U5 snRNP spliceosome subunit